MPTRRQVDYAGPPPPGRKGAAANSDPPGGCPMSASEQVAVHGAGERQPAPEQAAALPGSAGGRLLASRPLDGLRQIGIGLGIWAGYLLITRSVSVGLGSADARG